MILLFWRVLVLFQWNFIVRSPSGGLNIFLHILRKIIDKFSCTCKILLCCDFNVHFNTDDVNSALLCDLLKIYGFHQTIFEPKSEFNDFHLAHEGLSWYFVRDKTVGIKDVFQDFQDAFIGCYRTIIPGREVEDGRCSPGLGWYTEDVRSMRNNLNLISELDDKYKTEQLRQLRNRLKLNYEFELNEAKIAKKKEEKTQEIKIRPCGL
ncbi:hypothetical protein HHI36_010701 [Cryptolaemus montrouzieri]|uniref:Endonuclease/exonuclease/phosphatase domain-containing protein n=1 Tax=Cryptolaemus montrouzieri TaxID=559131 RepID=A0ABD2MJJ2_9CUCU